MRTLCSVPSGCDAGTSCQSSRVPSGETEGLRRDGVPDMDVVPTARAERALLRSSFQAISRGMGGEE